MCCSLDAQESATWNGMHTILRIAQVQIYSRALSPFSGLWVVDDAWRSLALQKILRMGGHRLSNPEYRCPTRASPPNIVSQQCLFLCSCTQGRTCDAACGLEPHQQQWPKPFGNGSFGERLDQGNKLQDIARMEGGAA